MGYYLNAPNLNNIDKAAGLRNRYGAEEISRNRFPYRNLAAIPKDKAVVCVVQNSMFDAAGLVYSEGELEAFDLPFTRDPRLKTWLLMDKAIAHKLAGYTEDDDAAATA